MNTSIPYRPSPRYIALLVGAALLILLIGAFLRPRAKEAVTVVPTNELATLPDRTQRRALRDMAQYVAERASEAGNSVIYLPDLGSSGLVLGQDSVLTAVPGDATEGGGPAARVRFLIGSESTGSARPAVAKADVDTSPRWRLVVARSPEGRNLALTGLTGGTIDARCGDFTLREMIFDAVVPPVFAGGGIFDLDGNVIGLAVPCGRVALVPIREVSRLLVYQESPEYQVWTRYGFRVQPADTTTGPLPGSGEGLLVTEVEIGSVAYRAGIRAGDLIALINRAAATRIEDLAPLLAEPGARRLRVQRGARGLVLTAGPGAASLAGLRPSPSSTSGLTLTTIEPQSRAARNGLKPGDRIVQVGRSRKPTSDLLRRALSDTTPVLVVYERDGRQTAVVLK